MTIKTSKYIEEDDVKQSGQKTLPSFCKEEKNNLLGYIALSAFIMHPLFVLLLAASFFIALFLGIHFPTVDKAKLKDKDIEFVLTQNEATPINKNTKYRSDKDSRAGGIHDPSKKVSMPSPAPTPAPKQPAKPASTPAPQQQKPAQKPVQKPAAQPKVAQKPAPPAPAKPTKAAAPVQKPVLKPTTAPAKPQAPKVVSAPSSPFKVEVPKTNAPVGKGFSAGTGTASSSGATSASTGGTSRGSGMPAPQFSTTRTASAGGGASRPSSSSSGGGYGTGNMGNPGPGNPKGAPGIDAIKSPQWGPYMRELESKIKRNWHPPKGDQSKRVVLLFKIGRRGELLSTKVVKSSGSQANDQAAVNAVQMSAPFRALPPEFTGSSVEIEFTFDYNVLGASYR